MCSPYRPIKTSGTHWGKRCEKLCRLCRCAIFILSMIIIRPLTVSAENEPVLSNHAAIIEDKLLQENGVIKPDARLPLFDETETSDPLQRRLSSLIAQNAENSDAHRQAAAPDAAADKAGNGQVSARHKWQTVLPVLGEEAEAKGHTLPLAFGVMPSFYSGRRHISVSDAQVSIKGRTIAVDGLTDIKVKSRELNWALRLDAWLFPFMNIYGLFGYTREDADASVGLTPYDRLRKRFGRHPKDFDIHIDLTGVTYGVGYTLVGGYKKFFASYDWNYTISALRGNIPLGNSLSPDVKAMLNSVRLGWRAQAADCKINFWIGETYWDTTNTIKGDPRVPVLGTVKFRVREKTSKPWSTHIGTNVELSPSIQLVLDMGSNFSGLFAIAPTLMYRF